MKAVLIRQFGLPAVMKIEEVERPTVSGDQVLVRVYYTSVNPVDWKIRNGSLRLLTGSKFPMRLGFDVAGEVVETGPAAAKLKKGDRVFGMLDFRHTGAYAEYVCVREKNLALLPENLDFREAAAVPLAGLTAYQALHYKGKLESGKAVLINGASGGVGAFAVQIARAAGALVTGVCGTGNTELVRSLGAETVINYREQDFAGSNDRYDVIFDAVGSRSFFTVSKSMKTSGRYVTTLPNKPSDILGFFLTSLLPPFFSGKKSTYINVRPSGPDLHNLCHLIKEKKLIPLIDRVFPLEEVAGAHAYSETGHARGKIVIKIS